MRDQDKPKEHLIAELDDLRRQIAELRASETRRLQAGEDNKFLLGKVDIEQHQLKALLDAVPCGVSITTDTSCREIRHNAVAAEFLRINPWDNASHTAPQPPPFKLLRSGKELLPEEMPIQRAAWRGETIVGEDVEFAWDDGVRKFSVWNARPLRDSNGSITGAVAALKDTTKRKEMEKELIMHREYLEELVQERTAELLQVNEQLQQEIKSRRRAESRLRRSEARFRAIFEGAAIGIALYDMTGLPVEINPAFQKMLGYTNAQLQRMNFTQFTHPDDLPRELPLAEELLAGKRDRYQLEKRYIKKDGQHLWANIAVSIIRDSKGKLRYAISMAEDISKRKRAERDLDHFFSISLDLFCIVGFDGYLKRFSPSFEKTLGYTREDLQARQLREFVHPGDRKQNLSMIQKVNSGEPVISYENRYLCKDGSCRWLEWVAVPVAEAGLVYAVGRDITERKQFKSELARLDRLNLVGEIAAGIGHEIRNPMTIVRGLLQILSDKEECQHYKEFYSLMIEELDRANSIITEFLSLAKNRTAELEMQNLNTIINTLNPLIYADAMMQDMNVQLELADVPDILLDDKEIRQLILNFVRNGLEAMGPGGKLTIKTFTSGSNLILAVQDQGRGIPGEYMDKLGTPFFTTKDTGTGLGLATCYRVAARHNATIKVETGPGGTTFYVSFKGSELVG